MRHALIVVDLPNSTTEERVAFRTALEQRGWGGYAIPFSYTKEFWSSIQEARDDANPSIEAEIVDAWFADGIHHVAQDEEEIEKLVGEQLKEAAAKAGVRNWRAIVTVSDEPATVLSS